MSETIEWNQVGADLPLPDDEITVLIYAPYDGDVPVWPGWHEDGVWYTSEGIPLTGGVLAWADMPNGPAPRPASAL
jgi:hypothetical protein